MGAVTGDHSLLKLVARAKINPPNKPTSISGATAAMLRAGKNWLQVQAAVTSEQRSRTPVLFTVPESVMRSAASTRPPIPPPYWTPGRLRKVLSLRAGLDVFIKG